MPNVAELDLETLLYIGKLRKEAQQMRRQRNGAREEADRLRQAAASAAADLAAADARIVELEAELKAARADV